MNRNITIVVIILVLAVIAAYLVWLRGQYQQQMTVPQASPAEQVQSPTPTPATTSAVTASPSASPKVATPSSTKK